MPAADFLPVIQIKPPLQMVEFASLEDVWGVDSFRKKGPRDRKASSRNSPAAALAAAGLGPSCTSTSNTVLDTYEPYSDRFMYVRGQPKSREGSGPRNIRANAQVTNASYDATTLPGQPTDVLAPSGSYVEYDDFYGTNLQYASYMNNSDIVTKTYEETAQEEEIQFADMQQPPHKTLSPQVYGEHVGASHSLVHSYPVPPHHKPLHSAKQDPTKYIYDLALHVLTGIFLILIMEQFLQLGTRLK